MSESTKEGVVRSENVPTERRKFLRSGAAAVGGVVASGAAANVLAAEPLAIPPTNKVLGRPVVHAPYGLPSKFEANVLRRNVEWLTPDTTASISFTPLQDLHGVITPAGLHFERYHAGAVDVDPETHRLVIHGMCDRPMQFTMDDLRRMPSHTAVHFLECTGVKLSTLMEYCGVSPDSTWFYAEGADGSGLQRSIPLPGAKDQNGELLSEFDQNEIHKDVIIAYAMNGEALRPENGYPLRLVVPGCEANMSIKYLRRMKFTNKPLVTYQETRHYAEVTNDGRIRQFTLVNEANSVITFPCPDKHMTGKGGVDVSTDGGKTWREAELVQPVMNKCFTRFTIPFDWQGEEHLIMSRAHDDSGYVQPTLKQLRDARGTNTIYHKNSIQTWRIEKSGEVTNVQINNV